jgi:CheY-like chemotaxis protein
MVTCGLFRCGAVSLWSSCRAQGESRLVQKHRPRVALVVDDSMLVRHCVARYLEQRGFTVAAASNGLDGLEKLSELDVDLIVTDMQMPHMDGQQFITELKKRPGTAVIPIIIVTARKVTGDQNESRANYSIFKDIDIESQLGVALAQIFGKSAAAGK